MEGRAALRPSPGYSQSQKRLRGTVRALLDRRISCLASRQRWQMKTSGTLDLRILAQERCIQVVHSLHSIMGRPAKGFKQKQVMRSQASSSVQKEERRGFMNGTLACFFQLAIPQSNTVINKVFFLRLFRTAVPNLLALQTEWWGEERGWFCVNSGQARACSIGASCSCKWSCTCTHATSAAR